MFFETLNDGLLFCLKLTNLDEDECLKLDSY